jgi:Flavin containing amine oxidoreductase
MQYSQTMLLTLVSTHNSFLQSSPAAFLQFAVSCWMHQHLTLPGMWLCNPAFAALRSYPKQGFQPGAGADLAAPVDDKLFFAGEHTNAAAGMTVHAAYDTGTRAALDVARAIGDSAGQHGRTQLSSAHL